MLRGWIQQFFLDDRRTVGSSHALSTVEPRSPRLATMLKSRSAPSRHEGRVSGLTGTAGRHCSSSSSIARWRRRLRAAKACRSEIRKRTYRNSADTFRISNTGPRQDLRLSHAKMPNASSHACAAQPRGECIAPITLKKPKPRIRRGSIRDWAVGSGMLTIRASRRNPLTRVSHLRFSGPEPHFA